LENKKGVGGGTRGPKIHVTKKAREKGLLTKKRRRFWEGRGTRDKKKKGENPEREEQTEGKPRTTGTPEKTKNQKKGPLSSRMSTPKEQEQLKKNNGSKKNAKLRHGKKGKGNGANGHHTKGGKKSKKKNDRLKAGRSRARKLSGKKKKDILGSKKGRGGIRDDFVPRNGE